MTTTKEAIISMNKKLTWIFGIVVIICVTAAIILAVVLTRDDSNRNWTETFHGAYSFQDGRSPDMRAEQLYLTQTNGNRLFVSKQTSPANTSVIQVFDYDQKSSEWILNSKLQAEKDIHQQVISNMVPSLDGNRVAISDSENVTVYRKDGDDSWDQAGETLTSALLVGKMDPSVLYFFGMHAMALSRDGKFLTLTSVTSRTAYNGTLDDNRNFSENEPFLIASFREVHGSWQLFDVLGNVFSAGVSFANPVLASSANAFACPKFIKRDIEWKEVVDVYTYSPSSKWTLSDTFVEPKSAVDDPSPVSHYGLDSRSIDFSYDGSTCAIGASGFEGRRGNYGRVEVYKRTFDDGDRYVLKGQVLEPSPDVYRFGELVALSSTGNRLAVYYKHGQVAHVEVFEYNSQHNEWRSLGSVVTPENDLAEYLSLSEDGSKVAIAWNCTPKRLYCLSVYELES